jgi:hypothetical protein
MAAIRTIGKIPARGTVSPIAPAIRCATREFPVAAEFSFGPIAKGTIAARSVAITRRPGTVGAIALWPVTTRRIGSLFASTLSRSIRLLVAEFPVLETPGRAGVAAFAARRVRALLAAGYGTIITVESLRTIAERPVAAGTPSVAVAFAGVRALFALGLAGETALGEFFLRPAGRAGAPLAAEGTVAPAAGIVVFVVIARHEWSLGWQSADCGQAGMTKNARALGSRRNLTQNRYPLLLKVHPVAGFFR